eukprot:2433855-Prymnesium_polylepis.1
MALKANVPIVPISIRGAFDTYPSSAILPLLPNSDNLQVRCCRALAASRPPVAALRRHARGAQIQMLRCQMLRSHTRRAAVFRGAQVIVHPQINVDGKEETELAELTRAAIASGL